jgi:hypothetical protein
MADSAALKVDRATKHIVELNELFRVTRPFSYILETNTKTGERATYAKKNEALIDLAALICGDAIHNLRAALDHAYWDIVSPFAVTDRERRLVQFPFCKTEAGLDAAIKQRLANRVSEAFGQALRGLKPYEEAGGNETLYLVDELDIADKHRLLVPTGDYSVLSSDFMRRQVPDFPAGIGPMSFSQNVRHAVWRAFPPMTRQQRRAAKMPSAIFEKELDVPVQIVFSVPRSGNPRPIIPTLYQMAEVTKAAIATIRNP